MQCAVRSRSTRRGERQVSPCALCCKAARSRNRWIFSGVARRRNTARSAGGEVVGGIAYQVSVIRDLVGRALACPYNHAISAPHFLFAAVAADPYEIVIRDLCVATKELQ